MGHILFLVLYIFSKEIFGLDDRHYTESIKNVAEPQVIQEELGEYFQGDMILTEEQMLALSSRGFGKNGLIDVTKRWPNKTVVYYFQPDEFEESQVTLIRNGMKDIENNSCIIFRERTNNEYAMRITNARSGCFSSVGYNNNEDDEQNDQVLNLGNRCYRHGTIVHEMLHTLGFYHMQSTYNRDDYVDIIWKNIQKGKERNFVEYDNNTVTDFGVPYDYGSVMHYSSRAFSKNGRRTIVPLQENPKQRKFKLSCLVEQILKAIDPCNPKSEKPSICNPVDFISLMENNPLGNNLLFEGSYTNSMHFIICIWPKNILLYFIILYSY